MAAQAIDCGGATRLLERLRAARTAHEAARTAQAAQGTATAAQTMEATPA